MKILIAEKLKVNDNILDKTINKIKSVFPNIPNNNDKNHIKLSEEELKEVTEHLKKELNHLTKVNLFFGYPNEEYVKTLTLSWFEKPNNNDFYIELWTSYPFLGKNIIWLNFYKDKKNEEWNIGILYKNIELNAYLEVMLDGSDYIYKNKLLKRLEFTLEYY